MRIWEETRTHGSDRAAALASFTKQANDEPLEVKAHTIRNRAIRRMEQVLEQVEPRANQYTKDGTGLSRKDTAGDARISEHQQKTVLLVASIPEDDFDAARAD